MGYNSVDGMIWPMTKGTKLKVINHACVLLIHVDHPTLIKLKIKIASAVINALRYSQYLSINPKRKLPAANNNAKIP